MVKRSRQLRRLEQLLSLVLLTHSRLQVHLVIARIELTVEVRLIEHLQLSRHFTRDDVHFRTATCQLLRVTLGDFTISQVNLLLQLRMLHLKPVER